MLHAACMCTLRRTRLLRCLLVEIFVRGSRHLKSERLEKVVIVELKTRELEPSRLTAISSVAAWRKKDKGHRCTSSTESVLLAIREEVRSVSEKDMQEIGIVVHSWASARILRPSYLCSRTVSDYTIRPTRYRVITFTTTRW